MRIKENKRDRTLNAQIEQFRRKYPDCLLMIEVGGFYEFFEGDAIIASKVLGIILTKQHRGD